MPDTNRDWRVDFDAARAGSRSALGRLLDEVRSYLTQIAAGELDSDVRVKEAASDLVQDSLLQASRDFAGFKGQSPGEFRQWLKGILLNNHRDLVAKYLAKKRLIARESPLDTENRQVVADGDSPSHEAMIKEGAARLQAALDKLSKDQRELIHLRQRENQSFAEIGASLGISEEAAQKRWSRAVEELRDLLL